MNPDFVIAGAPKCATTAVFDCLAQHSQVFATTPKEPHYFASSALGQAVMQSDLTHEQYQALFAGKQAGQVSGEGSTHYLHMADKVAARMASEIPAVRLIFCLRDPVARAFSHFQFRYSTAGPFTTGGAGQKRDFAAFIREPEMFSMGDYASNLAIFYQHFSKEQILLLFYEDIVQDLGGCMRRICDHIGVDTEFAFDLSQRSNQTVRPVPCADATRGRPHPFVLSFPAGRGKAANASAPARLLLRSRRQQTAPGQQSKESRDRALSSFDHAAAGYDRARSFRLARRMTGTAMAGGKAADSFAKPRTISLRNGLCKAASAFLHNAMWRPYQGAAIRLAAIMLVQTGVYLV